MSVQQTPIAAVILAGGTREDKVAAAYGVPVKALAELRGRPLVSYVVQAIAEADLRPVVVATSAEAADRVQAAAGASAKVVVASGPRFTDTLSSGLEAVASYQRVLLATGDLPLLTPAAVQDFLSEALATGADIVYSTVPRSALGRILSKGRRLFVRLKEGRFTGGNLVLANQQALRCVIETVERAFAGRKSPVALAKLLSVGFVLKYLLGRLDIPTILRRGEQVLQCKAAVIVSSHPEVCFDIDRPEDLHIAEQALSSRDEA